MLDELKKTVFQANLRLVREGLVFQTWGNVSGLDRREGLVVIKPSGVDYSCMKASDMTVVSLETGNVVEGELRPSSDTPTHLELYRGFPSIAGVVHTHSCYATAWSQAGYDLPAMGTTHADYFFGPIPCTRSLRPEEIKNQYECNTGRVIVERFLSIDPLVVPAVLVAGHGPFTWGNSPDQAVTAAVVLEMVGHMASLTRSICPKIDSISPLLLNRHFCRKHGPDSYYRQACS